MFEGDGAQASSFSNLKFSEIFDIIIIENERRSIMWRVIFSVTGGQWIFVLDKSGKKAYRRKITIGRQNPQYYEVIEGLEPGEQVIVSGYEAYKDNDVLVFN